MLTDTKSSAGISIVLAGGPATLGRFLVVDDGELPERVVVAHAGGNHHFERTAATEKVLDTDRPVYRWTYVTAIAE